MNQFSLLHGCSTELEVFPHIREFSLIKNTTIQLDSFTVSTTEDINIYYIVDGKFEWIINHQHRQLYPGDITFVLPGQRIGGVDGFLGIGSLFRLCLQVDKDQAGRIRLGRWSNVLGSDRIAIERVLFQDVLTTTRIKEAGDILHEMRLEIQNQEVGYFTRVNQLVDSLLIVIARRSSGEANARRDFPRSFMDLEKNLRKNLSHQWTVEEMSALVGLGTTAFTEKVKSFTGFSPLSYLINIRISEAIKLLNQDDVNVTDVALGTGFYSSQHFATTFKKLTGYTPSQYRRRNHNKGVEQ
jgi:AraC-like DNA-binding protein